MATVQLGGFSAQCPRCEAFDFRPAAHEHLLACGSCGTQAHRAELLQQIAYSARLTADVLAEHARRVGSMAN